MSPEVEERPTHVHTCDDCGNQFVCEIEGDCTLDDEEDYIQCADCFENDRLEDELDARENARNEEEDYE